MDYRNLKQPKSKQPRTLSAQSFLQLSLMTSLGGFILYVLTDGLWGYAELLEAHEYFLLAATLIGIAMLR